MFGQRQRQREEFYRELTELVRDVRASIRVLPGMASVLPVVLQMTRGKKADSMGNIGEAVAGIMEGFAARKASQQGAPSDGPPDDANARDHANGVNLGYPGQ